jgi:hypothetical protein
MFLAVSKAGVVMMLPWIYAVIRFTPIIDLEFGYPLPTDIASFTFLTVAFSFGCGYLGNSGVSFANLQVNGGTQEWGPSIALAGAMYLGMVFVGVMYSSAWSRGETPTVCFYMAVYAWLFTNGIRSIMLDAFIRVYGYDSGGDDSRNHSSKFEIASLNGPVYFFIPALTMMFRRSLYGSLGRLWAENRMKGGAEIACLLEVKAKPQRNKVPSYVYIFVATLSLQRATIVEGMDYWLHRPEICDEPNCQELKCKHIKCSRCEFVIGDFVVHY